MSLGKVGKCLHVCQGDGHLMQTLANGGSSSDSLMVDILVCSKMCKFPGVDLEAQ